MTLSLASILQWVFRRPKTEPVAAESNQDGDSTDEELCRALIEYERECYALRQTVRVLNKYAGFPLGKPVHEKSPINTLDRIGGGNAVLEAMKDVVV